jgi:hypothetical protein
MPAWTESPSMVLTTRERDRVLRISAWPEKSHGDSGFEVRFADSEAGRRAFWEVRRTLARSGEARLPSGATVKLNDLPEAVRAISEVDQLENATLKAEQSHPIDLAGELEGQTVKRSMTVFLVPPLEEGEDVRISEFGGIDNVLSLFVCFRAAGEHLALRVALDLNAIGSVDLDDALQAIRLLVAVDEGTATIEAPTLAPIGPLQLPPASDSKRRAEHRSELRFFEWLITIRDRAGISFELGEMVSAAEVESAAQAAEVLSSGRGHYTISQLSGDIDVEELAELREAARGALIARFPATAQVLGKPVDLGLAEAELPPPSSTHISADADPSRKLFELRWHGDPVVPFRIVSPPGDPRAEPGIWSPEDVPALGS